MLRAGGEGSEKEEDTLRTIEAKAGADTSTFILAGIGVAVLAVAAVIPIILFRAYVFTRLWQWYVVPRFDAAPLGMATAFGLSLIANETLHRVATKPKSDDESPGQTLLTRVGATAATLLVGWIGTWFL